MKVVALAGGIGAGKFLRGVARIVPGDDLTVILNVADDVVVHGLHVSPDPDSVTYWLGGVFDRERLECRVKGRRVEHRSKFAVRL